MKMSTRLAWKLLVLVAICLVVFNYFCVPAHDELGYCWLGLSTPRWGDCPRANSFMALVHQQIVGYNHDWSGRIFVHFLVGCFSGFGLHTLFDFCNAGMMLVLVWLMMKESGIQRTALNFLMAFCLVFLFMWRAVTFCRDAAFAINYLWMCSFTIVIVRLWRNLKHWWILPVFFVYGWSQESFVPSMVMALSLSLVWRSVAERRFAASFYQCIALVLMIVGCYYLCTAPAALDRAARMAGTNTVVSFVKGVIMNWTNLAYGIWPGVLVLCLVLLVIRNFKSLGAFLTKDIEWWLFTGAAWGSYSILGANGFHLCCAFLLGATLLCLKNRERLGVNARRWVKPLCVFSFVFFLAATVMQVRLGSELAASLARYKADPQGITYRIPITTHVFDMVCHRGIYNRWAASLFRRHLNHTKDPAFFSQDLYENLYLNPERFFMSAKRLGSSELYYSEATPCCLVRRGTGPLSPADELAKDHYLSTWTRAKPSWLPGRFLWAFPDQTSFLLLPDDEFTFNANDGKAYTIYTCFSKK